MKYVLAFDIGGTNTRAALIDHKLKMVHELTAKTPRSKAAALALVARLTREVASDQKIPASAIKGAAIAFAGAVTAGRIVATPHTPFGNVTEKQFARAIGRKVILENDMKCAALAELTLGAGRAAKNFVAVTVSTGIGSGIVIGGELYRGAHNLAGEIGHMPAFGGTTGADLETLASGSGLTLLYKRRTGKSLPPRSIQTLAEAGDKQALRAFDENAIYLGHGLAAVANVLDPELIVLSGSHIIRGWKLLAPTMSRTMKARAITAPKLVKSPLKGNAPILGAALLVFERE